MHQDSFLIYIGFAGIGAVVFFLLGYFIRKRYATKKLKNAEERAKKTLENAVNEADKLRRGAELEAKDVQLKAKAAFEKEVEATGGKVLTVALEPGYSTTNIVERILSRP